MTDNEKIYSQLIAHAQDFINLTNSGVLSTKEEIDKTLLAIETIQDLATIFKNKIS